MLPTENDLRALLPLYVGGDLSLEQLARVEAGLRRFPELERELAALAAARTALQGSAEPAPADLDLWPGVRAGLVGEGLLGRRAAGPLPVAPAPGPRALPSSDSVSDTPVSNPPVTNTPVATFPAGHQVPRLGLWAGSLAAAAALVFLLQLDRGGADPGAVPAFERVGAEPAGAPLLASEARSEAALVPVVPVRNDADGLRPILEGDPSMADTGGSLSPVWIRRPSNTNSGNSLAGYR